MPTRKELKQFAPKGTCTWVVRGKLCGKKTWSLHSARCQEHNLQCHCGVWGTHFCEDINGCKQPLCDNPYCRVEHNILRHPPQRITGWDDCRG